MKNDLLIVFLRTPELGRVKTRLAKTIGPEKALNIYHQLLDHTLQQAREVPCTKQAWFAETPPTKTLEGLTGFTMHEQKGDDLGARMSHAFAKGFAAGHGKVVIIGSDCPDLSSALIEQAFNELEQCDSVIGPARDGGYYLLGLRTMVWNIFRNKAWSTDTVQNETRIDLEQSGRSYKMLPELVDVDTEADLALVDLS